MAALTRSLLLTTLGVLAALGLMTAVAAAPAGAKLTQPNCAKQQKKVKKAKGKAKKKAKKALKQCRQSKIVYGQIKDSRFQGTRSDGISYDTIFCASGKFQVYVVEGGPAENGGWMTKALKFTNSKKYTTKMIGKVPGGTYEIGIQRNGKSWKIGRVSFDQVTLLGPATKSNGKQICAGL